uniref:Uncharacterized protein n=1 Tax=Timema douglasi TaxID=61478 RepID=A0A7R8V9N8_TIMDO|nr:unnamed protein product [Timema douglasi]
MGDKVKKIKKISRQRINIPPDDGPEREDEIMGRAGSSKDTKDPKRKRPSRERWLLTRKTWRYMADAGRRLIPDGALNRPEDIPKIEAYFQEVCHKEPRFLLWRKCSYPGALGFRSHKKNRRDRKKGGSCREKACSADEVEDDKHLSGFALHKTSSGRFDIQKLRQEFLKGSSLSTPSSTPDYFSRHKFQKPFSEQKAYLPDLPEVAGFQTEEQSPESEEQEMMDTLLYLLNRGETKETGEENVSETKTVDYTKLLYQLRRYLSNYNLEAKDGSYLASNDNLEVVKSDGDEASEGDVAADSDALESDGSSRNVIGVSTTNSRGITTVVKTSDNEKSRNIGKSNNSLSDNNRSSSPGKTVNSGDKTSLNSGKTITSISGKVTNSRKNISSVKTTLEDQASKIKGTAPFFNDSKKHERNVGIKSRTKTIRDGDREDKSGIGWTSHLRNVGGKSSIDQAGSNDGPSRNVRDTGENKSGIVGSSSGSGLRATSRSPSSSSSPHRSSYSLKENIHFEGDNLQKLLVETLRRYYSKSSSREKVISDLLTDRKLLEKLYYDLRKARGFKGRSGAQVRGTEETQKKNDRPNQESGPKLRHVDSGVIVVGEDSEEEYDEPQLGSWKRLGKPAPRRPKDLPPFSPPPLIEIQHEIEPTTADKGVQTEPIPTNIMVAIEEEIKREREREENEERQTKLPTGMNRRRSSVDHDDVSQSVSDTIKRYLKMARKKSVDSDKADRFKRVNYDRNLRNIKAKGEITKPGDDDGLNKGCQTDETWTTAIKELKLDEIPISSDTECSPIIDDYSGSRITSSRSSFDGGVCDDTLLSPPAQVYGKPHSPGILSSGQSFLSNLLHGLQQQQQQQQSGVTSQPSSPVAAAGVTMQKSKSSSSVVHQGSRLVAKKIWRNRSKSQSRATTSATSAWTPQKVDEASGYWFDDGDDEVGLQILAGCTDVAYPKTVYHYPYTQMRHVCAQSKQTSLYHVISDVKGQQNSLFSRHAVPLTSMSQILAVTSILAQDLENRVLVESFLINDDGERFKPELVLIKGSEVCICDITIRVGPDVFYIQPESGMHSAPQPVSGSLTIWKKADALGKLRKVLPIQMGLWHIVDGVRAPPKIELLPGEESGVPTTQLSLKGQCTWSNVMGRIVTLADTTLLQLTEVERRVMQKVALAKLQALNLGVTVRIPSDAVGNSTAHKPKRRAYLLKRKALTTGFFDTARGKDGDKEKESCVARFTLLPDEFRWNET